MNSLIKLAEQDKDIILLTGDLGYNFFEPFEEKYPDQFINVGCIEESMIGIAAGLALARKKPYVYSAANFLIFRAFEQVRNDVAYQNLNVKLLGFAGQSYNFLGYTHLPQNNEDLVMMRKLPNFEIHTPDTPEAAGEAVLKSYTHNKPTYIRLT